MRNTEERLLAVKLRSQEIERQTRVRNRRFLGLGSFAASLVFIIGLSFALPGLMDKMSDHKYPGFATAASIFDGSSFYGFVLIGFLAFALGASVTVLAYKIKGLNQESKDD